MKVKKPWLIMNWLEKTIYIIGVLTLAFYLIWIEFLIICFALGFYSALFQSLK